MTSGPSESASISLRSKMRDEPRFDFAPDLLEQRFEIDRPSLFLGSGQAGGGGAGGHELGAEPRFDWHRRQIESRFGFSCEFQYFRRNLNAR